MTFKIFYFFSGVSIVDFEQINGFIGVWMVLLGFVRHFSVYGKIEKFPVKLPHKFTVSFKIRTNSSHFHMKWYWKVKIYVYKQHLNFDEWVSSHNFLRFTISHLLFFSYFFQFKLWKPCEIFHGHERQSLQFVSQGKSNGGIFGKRKV